MAETVITDVPVRHNKNVMAELKLQDLNVLFLKWKDNVSLGEKHLLDNLSILLKPSISDFSAT